MGHIKGIDTKSTYWVSRPSGVVLGDADFSPEQVESPASGDFVLSSEAIIKRIRPVSTSGPFLWGEHPSIELPNVRAHAVLSKLSMVKGIFESGPSVEPKGIGTLIGELAPSFVDLSYLNSFGIWDTNLVTVGSFPRIDNNFVFWAFESEQSILETSRRLINRLYDIRANRETWEEEEGVAAPSDEVIDKSLILIHDLVSNELVPIRISPTVEEGICFVFRKGDEQLYLELYNDNEIGLIIENPKTKTILANESIESMESILPILLEWNSPEASKPMIDLL